MAGPELLETEVRYVTAEDDAVVATLGRLDVDRLVAGRPVRVVGSHVGQRHYSGLFWSATTGEHVVYESRLELDRLWLADFDAQVERIAAQPLWLVGRDGSALRRHVPDLLLRDRSGVITLVDVKPAWLLSRAQVSDVFTWTGRLCAARGWRYEVWSGGDLVVLNNIRLLGSARRRPFLDGGAVDAVTSAAGPGRQFGEVLERVAGRVPGVLARPALLWLLWSGTWTTELTAPLSRSSVLALPIVDFDATAPRRTLVCDR